MIAVRYIEDMELRSALLVVLLACGCIKSTEGAGAAETSAEGSATSGGGGSSTGVTTLVDETTSGCPGGCPPANCDESESGGSAGGDDTGFGMGGDPPLLASIPDVQRGRVPFESWVRVEGLVVTSPVIDAPVGRGSVFTVSDPGGGLYSAITVRVLASPADVPLERGEGVTLEARVTEGGTWLELRTLPELLVSDGVVAEPPPVAIDMETLQSFVADIQNARPYDSVVVSLPSSQTEDDGCAGELRLAYGGLRVDDRFLLAEGVSLPGAGVLEAVGGTLVSSLNGLEVAPRSLDELQP